MRQYFVHFFNIEESSSFRLYYADCRSQRDLIPEGARQISKASANDLLKLARRLHRKIKGCQADLAIFPADYDRSITIEENPQYMLVHGVWEVVR